MTESTTLAERQIAGYGLANGAVVVRLVGVLDRQAPAIEVRQERVVKPDWNDDSRETRREETVRVGPLGIDGPRRLHPHTKMADRVVAEVHDDAPRAYVRHERREGGSWGVVRAWEVHPAEGIVRTQEVSEA